MGPFLRGHSISICTFSILYQEGSDPTNLGQIVAEVGLLFDQGDQAVLDLQEDSSARLDLLRQSAVGRDGELLATIDLSAAPKAAIRG
jgi:hypothetical protein